ncbi:MAG: flagellar hook-length control protein FliK [Clostridiales bacterium]|nr:flagellar hook-length control protein FliK [Clostridiales bacterium]
MNRLNTREMGAVQAGLPVALGGVQESTKNSETKTEQPDAIAETRRFELRSLRGAEVKPYVSEASPIPAESVIRAAETNREKLAAAVRKLRRQMRYAAENVTGGAVARLAASGVPVERISLSMVNAVIQEASEGGGSRKLIEDRLADIGAVPALAAARLVSDSGRATLSSLYRAKFGAGKDAPEPSAEDAAEVMRLAGVPEGYEAETSALLAAGADVSAGNAEKTRQYMNIHDYIDMDTTAERMEELSARGEDPFGVEIALIGEARGARILSDLPRLGAADVAAVAGAGLTVTLGRLSEAARGAVFPAAEVSGEKSLAAISAKRRLLEIQLKMTADAARRLSAKGVDIETSGLKEILDGIRAVESEKYAKYLTAVGAEPSEENTLRMSALFAETANLSPISGAAVIKAATGAIKQDISSISRANSLALSAYESASGEPSLKYGDEFSKVSGRMSEYLEGLGWRPNAQNLRAAEIISRGGLEFTEENMLAVKLTDGRLREVIDGLNPLVAADLIRNGINPAELELPDLLKYIDAFNGAFGDPPGAAEAILAMSESGAVDKDELAAVSALCRLTNILRRDGGVAVARCRAAGVRPTLSNMLRLARTASLSVDKAVADDMIVVQSGTGSIASALSGIKTREYDDFQAAALVRRIRANIASGRAAGYSLDTDAEDAAASSPPDPEAFGRETSAIAAMESAPGSVVGWLLRNGIPFSAANVDAARRMSGEKGFLRKTLAALRGRLGAAGRGSDLDAALQGAARRVADGQPVEGIFEEICRALDGAALADGVGTAELASALKACASALSQAGGRGFKSLPILLGRGAAELSVYILNDEITDSGSASVYFALESEGMGSVSAMLETDGRTARIAVSSEDIETRRLLRDTSGELEDLARRAGFECGVKVIFA